MTTARNNAWIARYRICSTKGRLYTRTMVLDRAMRLWSGLVTRAELAAPPRCWVRRRGTDTTDASLRQA